MFDVLKNLDLNALPADVREVVLAVGEQNAALTAQVGELEALNARLEHFVKELNQIIYGKRSEKLGLMDDFEIWLKTQRSRVSAKSRLGEKLSYIAKYMDGLKLLLDDGSVEMDSNIVERAIRPIALNRKNALFAGHDEGGRTWARIASLIETCKLNGVEPYVSDAYLKATLEAIAAGHPAARINELMPWNFGKIQQHIG
jgi:transposase